MPKIQDIPMQPHFAIITETSVHTPGCHGHPASTDTCLNYEAFTARDAWEGRIRTLTARHETFHAIVSTPAKVETSIKVTNGNRTRRDVL